MIASCPHCKKGIKLSPDQKTKMEAALSKLKPGTSLKFKCPHCKTPIDLKPPEKNPPKQEAKKEAPKKPETKPSASPKKELPKPVNPPPNPPEPPDLSWLSSGQMDNKEVFEDVPTALIMIADDASKQSVSKVLEEDGYQLMFPKSAQDAISQMRFKDFAVVVFDPDFEGKILKESEFHKYMCGIAMGKRRYMIYVLVGSEFSTLYDLQTLAYSANIVVNREDAGKMKLIWRKGKSDYEELFNPFIAMLKSYGKR